MMEGDESLDQFICAKCGAPANQRCTGTETIIAAEKIFAFLQKQTWINTVSYQQVSSLTTYFHMTFPQYLEDTSLRSSKTKHTNSLLGDLYPTTRFFKNQHSWLFLIVTRQAAMILVSRLSHHLLLLQRMSEAALEAPQVTMLCIQGQ